MSDLIDRQAAIDAANRTDYRGLTIEEVTWVTDEVVKELQKLPSAGLKWIPVSERLPEKDGDYLVCFDEEFRKENDIFDEVGIVPYQEDCNEEDCSGFGYWVQSFIDGGCAGEDWEEVKVTAWMPIPPVYRGGNE